MKRVTHFRNNQIASPSQTISTMLPAPDTANGQVVLSANGSWTATGDGWVYGKKIDNVASGYLSVVKNGQRLGYQQLVAGGSATNMSTGLYEVNTGDVIQLDVGATGSSPSLTFFPVNPACYTMLADITFTQMVNKVGVFTPNAAGAGISMEFIQSGSIISVRISGTKANTSTGAIGTLSNLVINKNVQFTAFNGDGNVVRIEMSGTTISMYGTLLAGTWVVGSTSFNNNDEAGVTRLMEYKPHVCYPNLWTPNTEVDLGNGLFGYRGTGTITQSANTYNLTVLIPSFTGAFIGSGGQWVRGGTAETYYLYAQYTAISSDVNVGGFLEIANNNLNFRSMDNQGRTNAPYDVWVTYTK
ncbi:MAG: hypothetical protein Ta2A_11160 [Treponemataceae bacterium]|nr:MAG: hypothetical protein Ta2A_11160 [Treponemataceae bacterium]